MTQISERFAHLLGERYQQRLESEPELTEEGLLLHFDTGLSLEVVPVGEGTCAYHWRWSEPEWAMETDIRGMDMASFCEQNGRGISSVGGDLSEPTQATWSELLAVLDALFRPTSAPR